MGAQLWNTTPIQGAFTYSNGNKTVATTTGNAVAVSQGFHFQQDGKVYYELLVNSDSGNSNFALGDWNNTNWVFWANDGTLATSDGGFHQIGTVGTYTTGSLVRVAIDLTNKLIWIMTDGVKWNNSTTANPATNTGGLAYTQPLNPLFIAYFAGNNGNSATLKTTAADFTSSPPTGFTAWESGAPLLTGATGGWGTTAFDGPTAYFTNGGKTVLKGPNDTTVQSFDFVTAATGGKRYVEVHIDAFEYGDLSIHNAADTHYIHLSYDGTIFRSDGTVLMPNGTLPFILGDTVCFAFDAATNTVWFRVNAGNWNGSPTANPATGVGGFVIPFTAGGENAYVKAAMWNFEGSSRTLNTGTSAFAQTMPSGFSPWVSVSTLNATLAKTLGALTGAATASASTNATLAKTLGALTTAAVATDPTRAALAQNLGALTAVAVATDPTRATVAKTLDALTSTAVATNPVNGAVAQTLGVLTLAATAQLTSVSNASLNAALGEMMATAVATDPVNAAADNALDAMTAVAAAHNSVNASTTPTLGVLSANASASVPGSGSVAQTLGPMTVSASAALTDTLNASLNATLGLMSVSAIAAAQERAIVDATLGALIGAAVASNPDNATEGGTLGLLSVAAVAQNPDNAQLSQTLDAMTVNAHSGALTGAIVDATLGGLTAVSVATNPVNALATPQLGALTAAITVNLPVDAEEGGTLGALTVAASASVPLHATMNATLGALTLKARVRTTNVLLAPAAMLTI